MRIFDRERGEYVEADVHGFVAQVANRENEPELRAYADGKEAFRAGEPLAVILEAEMASKEEAA